MYTLANSARRLIEVCAGHGVVEGRMATIAVRPFSEVSVKSGVFMKNFLLALFLCGLVSGCGQSDPEIASNSAAAASLANLPATVEGEVLFDVIEGDDEFGDYGNWNFGTLTIGTEEFLVEADGEVLRDLKIPEAGGRVVATISSMKVESGMPMYKITSIQAQ